MRSFLLVVGGGGGFTRPIPRDGGTDQFRGIPIVGRLPTDGTRGPTPFLLVRKISLLFFSFAEISRRPTNPGSFVLLWRPRRLFGVNWTKVSWGGAFLLVASSHVIAVLLDFKSTCCGLNLTASFKRFAICY